MRRQLGATAAAARPSANWRVAAALPQACPRLVSLAPPPPPCPASRALHGSSRPTQSTYISSHFRVDPATLATYLERKDLAFKETPTHLIVKHCPLCHKPHGDKADNLWKLYVRRLDGAFFCHRCGSSGSWFDFKQKMGDLPGIVSAGSAGSGAPRGASGGDAGSSAGSGMFMPGEAPGFSGGNSGGGYDGEASAWGRASSSSSSRAEPPAAVAAVDLAHASQSRDDLLKHGKHAAVLDYLVSKRKLSPATLERYCVGAARRRFASDDGVSYAEHDCVVFPWIMPKAAPAVTDSLHGALIAAAAASNGGGGAGSSDGATAPPPWGADTHVCTRLKIRSVTDKSRQAMAPRGGGWGLFGLHTVPRDATSLVLTEGEYDAMSVWQETGVPAVSLPNGCRSFPPELLPYLERFERIYLWMDDDVAGREGCDKVAAKLGTGRCYIVRPTPTALALKSGGAGAGGSDGAAGQQQLRSPKDANEALQNGLDLRPLLESASPRPHDQILSFDELRPAVMREVSASLGLWSDEEGEGGEGGANGLRGRRSPSGWPIRCLPRLGSLIKGHRPGELTIVTGGTGSGKTTFLTQLSLDLASQGVRTLWGSFEIKVTRLIASMLQQLASGRIAVPPALLAAAHENVMSAAAAAAASGGSGGVFLPPAPGTPAATMQRYDAAADVLQALPLSFLRFYGSTDLDRVLDALEYAAYVNDVEHVILDNLQFMMSASTAGRGIDKFDLQEKAIDRFRAFATRHDVHVTLVIHPRKEAEDSLLSLSSVFGSAKATQEADTVVILQRDAKTGRKFLDVKKNRFDGQLGTVPLVFDASARCFVEDDGVGGNGVAPPGVGGMGGGGGGGGSSRYGGGGGQLSPSSPLRSLQPSVPAFQPPVAAPTVRPAFYPPPGAAPAVTVTTTASSVQQNDDDSSMSFDPMTGMFTSAAGAGEDSALPHPALSAPTAAPAAAPPAARKAPSAKAVAYAKWRAAAAAKKAAYSAVALPADAWASLASEVDDSLTSLLAVPPSYMSEAPPSNAEEGKEEP